MSKQLKYSFKKLKSFFSFGWFPFLFALLIPLVNGCLFTALSALVTDDISNRFILGILAASASYIAAPAAVSIGLPEANAPLALMSSIGVTFPFNLLVGIPLYLEIARAFSSL